MATLKTELKKLGLQPVNQVLFSNALPKDRYACRVGNSPLECRIRAEQVCEAGTKGTIMLGINREDKKNRLYAFVLGSLDKFQKKNPGFKWSKLEVYTVKTADNKEPPMAIRLQK